MDEMFSLRNIEAVSAKLADDVLKTPLVRLNRDIGKEIYLKLENLQSIGAFKLRGAGNAMKSVPETSLENGVWTTSAGNMAQGVAWYAKRLGIPSTIVVPDTAPRTKLDAIRALDGEIVQVPIDEWFEVMRTHKYEGMDGHFIHPFADDLVMQGNATIALEIYQEFPEVDTVIVPYGGGGLISGIARFLKQVKPEVKIFACEPETAAPVHASINVGEPTGFDYTSSFVDGMGAPLVFDDMWPYVKQLVTHSLVVSLEEIADAIRLLMHRHNTIAEGAGAAPVAAALAEENWDRIGDKIVCIVSGGNIDPHKLVKILEGEIP